LRLPGLESESLLITGPGPWRAEISAKLGCGSGSSWGAEGRLPDRVLSVDFCLSSLSMSNRAVSLCLSNSFSLLFASLSSCSRFLTEAMTASTMSSASSPNTDPVSAASVVGVGGRCIESTSGDLGVGGPEGTLLTKWTSNGFTHALVLLGVPGRDPNPGPGPARLVEEPLFAPKRDPNPGAGAARLVEDIFCAPNRGAKPGAGPTRLIDEPLFVPKRVRMLISEA
jgi:hypothetical protein